MSNAPVSQIDTKTKVIVVGGGFAGLHAVKGLANLPVEILLIDRKNHHTFQPLLYQVATATLTASEIAQPIRTICRNQPNVTVIMDEVLGFDLQAKSLKCKELTDLHWDYLIVASGATHSYFGNDSWAAFAPGLKTIEDALEIRRRILSAFETAEREMRESKKQPPLNFVIIGGGPTGVELAGAISETAKTCMNGEYRLIDPTKARVLLIEGLPRILNTYSENLSASATKQLEDMGVEVLTSQKVLGIKQNLVETDKGPIEAAVILWAAGVQGSPLGKMLGVETDRRGCVIVDRFLNPANQPKVFVCGDLAHLEIDGKQVPGVAPCAMQMGAHVAAEIIADLRGKERKEFHYFDRGDMATIGRRRAVANVRWPFKAQLTGLLAWLSWLFIHLLFLIGLRNRMLVLVEWSWSYLFRQHGARLITDEKRE